MEIVTLTNVPADWADPILTADEAYHLLTQPHHVLFAVGESGVGGHLLARMVPGTPADIITLYVPPIARRCGHAKALVEATILTARHLGCTGLTLEVNATNAAAVALYTVCGLQQVASRANYYPNPVSNLKDDALVLAVSFA
jgi:ribosomal-protein-alanine N-acetyltransferase